MRRPALTFIAVLFMGGSAAQAAEDLIDRGIELRRSGQDGKALEVFEQAYAQTGSARALAQVALAHQALGHWVEAEESLERALKMGGDWIARNEAPLRGALNKVRARLGTLEVRGEPVGATVVVNGRDVGALPLTAPLRVVAGDVVVQVSADDYVALTRRVPVEAGKRVRETIRLVPDAAAGAKEDQLQFSPSSGRGSVFFGTPSEGSLILEAGFSSLPGVTLLQPANEWFAIGLKAGIDTALFGSTGPDIPGTLTTYAGVPLILEMVDDPSWVARLSLMPALGFTVIDYGAWLGENNVGDLGFDLVGEYFAVLLHASLDVGRRLNGWFTLGGGVDVPTTFFYGGGTDLEALGASFQPEEFSVVPVLVGPTAEFRLSPQARIALAVRAGPHFTTGDVVRTDIAGAPRLTPDEGLQTEFGFAARLAFAFAL